MHILLYFSHEIRYNISMEKTNDFGTSNAEMITISRAEYEKFLSQEQQLLAQKERITKMEHQVEVLMEALRLARHKQFGASSEKTDESVMEQLTFLFDEAEVFAETKAEEEAVTVVAAHKRHKKHEYTLDNIPENMPKEQVEHRLEGEDLVCPQCGDTMTEIGKEVVRTLKIIPAKVVVKEISTTPMPARAVTKPLTMAVRHLLSRLPEKRISFPAVLRLRRPFPIL